jgi:tetratricopeptide (TPR) repeat protein
LKTFGFCGSLFLAWTVICSACYSSVNLYNRGVEKQERGDLDGAIADYTNAIEINPDFSSAYYNRGIAWAKKEKYEQAIKDFEKVAQIDPHKRANAEKQIEACRIKFKKG